VVERVTRKSVNGKKNLGNLNGSREKRCWWKDSGKKKNNARCKIVAGNIQKQGTRGVTLVKLPTKPANGLQWGLKHGFQEKERGKVERISLSAGGDLWRERFKAWTTARRQERK